MRGFTAAVWAITAWVAVSTFSTALQHGHVTSKGGEFFAILRIIPQTTKTTKNGSKRLALKFDGENAEDAKKFPAQQENREQDDQHSHQFTES